MDLSKLSDAELEAIVAGKEDLSKLSDAELEAIVKGGAAPNAAPVAGAAPQLDAQGRVGGILLRSGAQGAVGGILGIPALAYDAANNLSYGTAKLGSKLGLREAPKAEDYGMGDTHFPALSKAAEIGKVVPDKLGLPVPENSGERVLAGVVEGAAGAFSPVAAARTIGAASLARGLGGSTPKLTTAAGAAGGGTGAALEEMGTGPVISTTGGVAAGVLPFLLQRRPGIVKNVSTPEGQERAAGRILRDATGVDAQTAISRIDEGLAVTRNRATPELREFQHTTPNLVRDPRLATQAEKMREWSGRGLLLESENSSALSRAFDAQGAGQSAATRQAANAAAEAGKAAMDLPNRGAVDITGVLDRLQRSATVRGTGLSSEAAGAYGEIRQALLDRARPVVRVNAQGTPEIIGYRINPRDLAAARQDLAQARFNTSNTSKMPMVRGAPAQSRAAMTELDGLLDNATNGEWRQYLTQQSTARANADTQGFLGAVAEKAQTGWLPNGDRSFDKGTLRRQVSLPKNENVRLSDNPNGRGVSLARVRQTHPEAGRFLDEVADTLTRDGFERLPGARPASSPTSANLNIEDRVTQAVEGGQSAGQRALRGLQSVGMAGTYLASSMAGPLGNAITRFGSRVLGAMTSEQTAQAQKAVRGFLGDAYLDPRVAQRLYQMPDFDRVTARSTAIRAGKSAFGGTQGFLAAERERRNNGDRPLEVRVPARYR